MACRLDITFTGVYRTLVKALHVGFKVLAMFPEAQISKSSFNCN